MKTAIFLFPLLLLLQCKSPKNIDEKVEKKSEIETQQGLIKTSWLWIYTKYENKTVEPIKKDEFIIKFDTNRINVSTDCNGMTAVCEIEDNNIRFSDFISTRKLCVGSQEGEFFKMLSDVKSYNVSNNNTLLKIVLNNEAIMVFNKIEMK